MHEKSETSPSAGPTSAVDAEEGDARRAVYTHTPLGQEIQALAGYYVVEAENRIPFAGREVLVLTGHMIIDNSCCGVGGCGFALVPGYVLSWKALRNERGEPVSEVEPIRAESEREALRRLLLNWARVQQVNFW